MNKTDKQEIDKIVSQFFDLFTNTNNKTPEVHRIKDLYIPQGIIINNTGQEPQIYDLESFIKPREELLTNGSLLNFEEWETNHTTKICGKIAQRNCEYEKSGILNGESFTGKGTKMMQFVKIGSQWFFTSVIWQDN